MKIGNICVYIFVVMSIFSFVSCEDNDDENNIGKLDVSGKETMYQVATLQSLMVGNYDGFVRIDELKKHGDIGLGTFNRVNGEMIVLDGNVYQALGDGNVKIADNSETTPFSTVTYFEPDIISRLSPFDSISALTHQLDSIVYVYGRNFIYALKLDVKTKSVTFRSELPQNKPYGPLAQVLPDKQRTFVRENLEGIVVAVYFPSFFAGQNTPGWHFHFISSDRERGGHMLQISTAETSMVQLDATPYFGLYLPEEKSFSQCDLSDDMSGDIGKVEH